MPRRSVCCPYPLLAIPFVLSFVAFIFGTIMAVFGCYFFSITYGSGASQSMGLWNHDTYPMGCLPYEDDVDAAIMAGRVFGVIACVLASICLIMIIIALRVSFEDFDQFVKDQFIKKVGNLMVFTGISTMLTLVVLASDVCKSADSCKIGVGGIMAVVTPWVWFLCACLMGKAMKYPRTLQEDIIERDVYNNVLGRAVYDRALLNILIAALSNAPSDAPVAPDLTHGGLRTDSRQEDDSDPEKAKETHELKAADTKIASSNNASDRKGNRNYPEWRYERNGDQSKLDRDGKTFWWCEALNMWAAHQPRDCKAEKNACIMKDENDEEKQESKMKLMEDEDEEQEA